MAMAAIAAALWIGAGTASDPGWERGFLVAAWIASAVLSVAAVVSLVSWMRHRKDVPPPPPGPRRTVGITIQPSAGRTVVEGSRFHNLDTGIKIGGEDNKISGAEVHGPDRSPVPNEKPSRRRKRKRPPSTDR